MARQIFVNLPVKDLQKSMDFFGQLGFGFNPQFTDEKAACMIVGGNIYVMLLTTPFFQTFTKKAVSDAHTSTEVLIGLDAESREQVDAILEKALQAGGKLYGEPQDHGWMYQRSFADPDGHQWEFIYMDATAIPQQ